MQLNKVTVHRKDAGSPGRNISCITFMRSKTAAAAACSCPPETLILPAHIVAHAQYYGRHRHVAAARHCANGLMISGACRVDCVEEGVRIFVVIRAPALVPLHRFVDPGVDVPVFEEGDALSVVHLVG